MGPRPPATSSMAKEAYEVIQKELADLLQELLSLHHSMAINLGCATHEPGSVAGGGGAPALTTPPTVALPKPVLWGDQNSPLSTSLEAVQWSTGFKMPNIKAYKGTPPVENHQHNHRGSLLGLGSKRQRGTYARQIYRMAAYPANTHLRYTEVPIIVLRHCSC